MASKAKAAVRPAITATAIDHVVLYVSDLERSVEFYTGILGMTEHHGGSGYMFLRCGDQVVGLFETEAGEMIDAGNALNHMAFNQSSGGYEEVKANLESRGVAVRGRRGDPRCIYFDDPDGHTLQFNVR